MIELEHELYKAREVADLLRLNTKTVYGWVNRGTTVAIRTPTGGIRIPKSEVLRLLTEHSLLNSTSDSRLDMSGVIHLPNVAGGEGVDKHLPHE